MADINMEMLEEDGQKGKFMTFQTGNEVYGISISYVNEIIVVQPITTIPEVPDYVKGLINLRGKIIPVIDVRTRFNLKPIEYTDRTCIIVLDVKSMTIGLIVERIAEVENILDEDIVPPPKIGNKENIQNKYVYGVARTKDNVKLLLDPEKLIKDEDLSSFAEANEDADEDAQE